MGTLVPTYHLPPNFSTRPPGEGGPLQLGTVLRDFEKREQMRPLNQDASSRLAIPPEQIHPDHKGGFEATRERLKSGAMGFWAQFLGVEGLGAELGVSGALKDTDTYSIESVDTEFFYPSPEYITSCMELPPVKGYIDANNSRKPVFLITGIKVAKGIKVKIERNRGGEFKAEGGVPDPSGSGAVVGAMAEVKAEKADSFAFTESTDIVIGIQCIKLHYKSKWHGLSVGKLQDEYYTEGAVFLDADKKPQPAVGGNYVVTEIVDGAVPGFKNQVVTDDEGREEVWYVPSATTEQPRAK